MVSFTPPGIFALSLIPFSCASLNSSGVALRFIPSISVMVGFFEEEGAEPGTEVEGTEAAPGTEVEGTKVEEDGAEGITVFLGAQSFISGSGNFICSASFIRVFFFNSSSSYLPVL